MDSHRRGVGRPGRSRSPGGRLVRGACGYDPARARVHARANSPHAKKYVEGVRSRARVVSAGELVDDVGDERPDDGNGVGDAAAGAGGVDDERALVRSRSDADEAS